MHTVWLNAIFSETHVLNWSALQQKELDSARSQASKDVHALQVQQPTNYDIWQLNQLF